MVSRLFLFSKHDNSMRKLLFFTFVCLLMPSNALAAVNDIFTAKTEEGVEMTFQITIDTEEYKYCQVGGFIYNEMKIIPAIDKATTGKITIPQTVNGYTVESISYLAFMNCEGITEVVISEGVRGINMCAFRGCRNLAKVTIPNSVTAIDDMAFYGCNLTSVQIPDGCSIDIFAFANNKISVLDIPKSCSVGKCAFAYNDIKEINISQENPLYGEYADCNAVIKDNTLIVGCSKTVIPHEVTTIANGAFSCCSALTEITIPSTVTSIAHEQYKVNVIGNFVITLNETTTFPSAFYGCENLERVCCMTATNLRTRQSTVLS